MIGLQKFESLEQSFVLLYGLIVILCKIFWRDETFQEKMKIWNFENVENLTQHFVEPVILLVAELQLETEFPLKREQVKLEQIFSETMNWIILV